MRPTGCHALVSIETTVPWPNLCVYPSNAVLLFGPVGDEAKVGCARKHTLRNNGGWTVASMSPKPIRNKVEHKGIRARCVLERLTSIPNVAVVDSRQTLRNLVWGRVNRCGTEDVSREVSRGLSKRRASKAPTPVIGGAGRQAGKRSCSRTVLRISWTESESFIKCNPPSGVVKTKDYAWLVIGHQWIGHWFFDTSSPGDSIP